MERSVTEPCKISFTLDDQTIFYLKMHALQLTKESKVIVRPSDVVKSLITEHIPTYGFVDKTTGEFLTLAEVRARESVMGNLDQESDGAKPRGSKRDGKEQADRTRGRARG
jgi:hypothetical protein